MLLNKSDKLSSHARNYELPLTLLIMQSYRKMYTHITVYSQDILHNLVKECEEKISEKEREKLFRLLLKYADVFADRDDELGRSSAVQHSINTDDHHTIKQPCKQIPLARQEHVHKMVEEMLAREVIQPSNSLWASQVVLAQKNDGTYRFCVDYWKLNSVACKDVYL